ncbi:MAG: hypothetical protein JWP19_1922 [Rhodoglobus sp.]|nr:hypothetical protein [Rhodoglobus sp.]
MHLMNAAWMPAAIAFAAWLVTFSLQLADLGTARFDSRRLARGARTVVRLHPVAWVIPVAAIAIVGVGFGLDFATRLLVAGSTVFSIIVGLSLVVGVVAAWLVITVAVTKPAADSYRAIRDELLDLAGTRVQQQRLDSLRARLATLDTEGDISQKLPHPSFGASIGWVFRRPQRIVPPAFAVAMLVFVAIAASEDPAGRWAVALAAAAVVLGCLLAVAGARASLTLVAAVREAQVAHRVDVVHLLAEAERSAKKPVAGLGDRVARALQILREQQG